MSLVVDSSVAVKWFFEEPLAANARRLLDRPDQLIAPDLLVAEVANAAWKKLTRGQITMEQGRGAVASVTRGLTEVVACDALAKDAWSLSVRLAHPAYDCFYLALAEARSLGFVTDDARLLAVAQAAKMSSVIPLESV